MRVQAVFTHTLYGGDEMIITNNNVEYVEVKGVNDGNIAIIKKNRINGKWDTKTNILTRRESLKLNQAISNIILGYEK